MSSSLKDVTIKAFRRSKDAEVPNNIEEQQTAAPVKKKTGAKVKKMAARVVPAALGKFSHPWMLSCAPCDVGGGGGARRGGAHHVLSPPPLPKYVQLGYSGNCV